MKKIYVGFSIILGFFLAFQNSIIYSNSSTPPLAQTGSISSNGGCDNASGGCHTGGTAATISFTVFNAGTTVPVTTYQPGQTYDISVTVSGSGNATPKYGFEMDAEDNGGTNQGTFSLNALSNTINTQILAAGDYVSHHTANAATSTWNFSWTAPASAAGIITFYAGGVYADGNGFNSGDQTTTNSFSLNYCAQTSSTINKTTCANVPYNLNGKLFSSSGTFKDTIPNHVGCDSVITLTLAVLSTPSTHIYKTICANRGYAFNSHILNASGTYYDTFTSHLGCDSFLVLDLKVLDSFSVVNQNICHGDSFLFNGHFEKTTGIYTDSFTNILGCDSFVYLHLNVINGTYGSITRGLCKSSVVVNGHTYSSIGNYQDTILNHSGCDSFITVHIIAGSLSTKNINQTICAGSGGVSFGGHVYHSTGVYKDTLTNYLNCDSIISLHLHVSPLPNDSVLLVDTTLIAQGAGQYQWIDCSTHLPIAGANANLFIPPGTGHYAVIISVNGCTDTSKCVYVNFSPGNVGVKDFSNPDASLHIFPNPAHDKVFVNSDMENINALVVLNAVGETVWIKKNNLASKTETIDLSSLPNGVYLIEIRVGENIQHKKIVKF